MLAEKVAKKPTRGSRNLYTPPSIKVIFNDVANFCDSIFFFDNFLKKLNNYETFHPNIFDILICHKSPFKKLQKCSLFS